MAIKIGTSQFGQPAPRVLQIVANTVIIGSGIVSLLIAPMPDSWVPLELKNYMLTVAASSGGFLKILEKLTGEHPSTVEVLPETDATSSTKTP